MKSFRRLFIAMAFFALWASMSQGQGMTIRPTPPELGSFLVMNAMDFRAQFGHGESPTWIETTNGWTSYQIMHLDHERLKAKWAQSRLAEKIHVEQCAGSAEVQRHTARDFAPYADLYSYWAFLYTSTDKPPKGELLWGELDDPFINQLRQVRKAVGTTPIVALLPADGWRAGSSRPAVLEEIQWQFIAVAGCGYTGVLWPVYYKDPAWDDHFKQIEETLRKYAHSLARAQPVHWAKAAKDQAISSLACDNYLFVFLLNSTYMKLDADGKTVTVPLEKPLCEGTITLALPEGIRIRQGHTLLGGDTLRLASEGGKTTAQFSFKTGGEMMVFALSGKATPSAATQPTTEPAATRSAAMEITR